MDTNIPQPVQPSHTPPSSPPKVLFPMLFAAFLILIFGSIISGYIGYQYGYQNGKTVIRVEEVPDSIDLDDEASNITNDPLDIQSAENLPWSTYISQSEGFSIEYPQEIADYEGEWKYEEYPSMDGNTTIGFGPISVVEDSIWAVNIYTEKNLEEVISEIGFQFPDRQESRENIFVNGRPAIMLTVTTPTEPDWVAKTVLLEHEDRVYSISNGAIEIPEFDRFYQSFKILN